jgi:hypothetical protein
MLTEVEGQQAYSNLDDAVLRMSLLMLDHETEVTEYGSIIISFIMVLSVRTDKTWETYLNLTPELSAIKAISHLIVVTYAVSEQLALFPSSKRGLTTRRLSHLTAWSAKMRTAMALTCLGQYNFS